MLFTFSFSLYFWWLAYFFPVVSVQDSEDVNLSIWYFVQGYSEILEQFRVWSMIYLSNCGDLSRVTISSTVKIPIISTPKPTPIIFQQFSFQFLILSAIKSITCFITFSNNFHFFCSFFLWNLNLHQIIEAKNEN